MSGLDSLGDRMKRYEAAFDHALPGRMPVIIRVDGNAFHTYTRGGQKPFDPLISDVMVDTAKELCERIQGAQFAYTQSDEISIFVHGYKRLVSQPWFHNRMQKMASVAAGIASATFTYQSWRVWGKNIGKPAVFDARVFVVPESDLCNYFIWRQKDWIRNSIEMLARSLHSHKECMHKNGEQLKDMCLAKGKDWHELDSRWRRGVVIYREQHYSDRPFWKAELEPPIFSSDRQYIERHLDEDDA